MMYLGYIKGENFTEQALCVYFKQPRSYTGEDVVEFHCHGGQGVANAVLKAVRRKRSKTGGSGRIHKKSFLNGKINLAQAEGIMDMINAQSESEIMQSFKQLSGEISKGIYQMQDKLIKAIAGLEVRLDYPEETEDEPDYPYRETLEEVIESIDKLLQGAKLTKTISEGVNVAIAGLPNVGKSSLLNGLIMADRAIVTEYEGTTRDVIKEQIEIDGIKFNILDTAGIRKSDNVIENIGIEKITRSHKSRRHSNICHGFIQTLRLGRRKDRKHAGRQKGVKGGKQKDIAKYPRKKAIEIKANPPREIEEVKRNCLKWREKKKFTTAP